MTSSELTKLKKEYQVFRGNISQMITYNTNAIDKVNGSDILLRDNYSINSNSADGEFIKSAIDTINDALSNLKSILNTIDSEIRSLERQIEIARDREMAAAIQRSSSTRTVRSATRRTTVGRR